MLKKGEMKLILVHMHQVSNVLLKFFGCITGLTGLTGPTGLTGLTVQCVFWIRNCVFWIRNDDNHSTVL